MKIAIIGTGLIGGSLAISLKASGFADQILGVDKSDQNLKKALEIGFIDQAMSLDQAIQEADLFILTIPVDGIVGLLPTLLDGIRDEQVVLEMGSTKEAILNAVDRNPKRGRLVAMHPMAGTEYSGPEAAIPNLYKDKTMIFCDVTSSDEDAFDLAEALVEALNMKVVFMNAREHDIHTAYVSHISHITSFALALTVLEKEKSQGRIFELAGSGFESTVRLAKSSAEMWIPIFKQNKKNVLDVLEEHIHQLQEIQSAIKDEDYEKLRRSIKKSNKIKRILK